MRMKNMEARRHKFHSVSPDIFNRPMGLIDQGYENQFVHLLPFGLPGEISATDRPPISMAFGD